MMQRPWFISLDSTGKPGAQSKKPRECRRKSPDSPFLQASAIIISGARSVPCDFHSSPI